MNPTSSPDPERRFRRLYAAHYPALLAYARRRTSDVAEAHDIVADTFLVLWRRLRDAPEDDGEVLLWLYGVARRVLANRLRSRRRQERVAARIAEVVRDGLDAEELATQRLDARCLLDALRELSENEREILLLSAWEQLSNAQIGVVLECSENAAAIRLHRARKRLTDVYRTGNVASGHRRGENLRARHFPNRRQSDG